jgi:hypothetical protein
LTFVLEKKDRWWQKRAASMQLARRQDAKGTLTVEVELEDHDVGAEALLEHTDNECDAPAAERLAHGPQLGGVVENDLVHVVVDDDLVRAEGSDLQGRGM